jgi:hypothetical protein
MFFFSIWNNVYLLQYDELTCEKLNPDELDK